MDPKKRSCENDLKKGSKRYKKDGNKASVETGQDFAAQPKKDDDKASVETGQDVLAQPKKDASAQPDENLASNKSVESSPTESVTAAGEQTRPQEESKDIPDGGEEQVVPDTTEAIEHPNEDEQAVTKEEVAPTTSSPPNAEKRMEAPSSKDDCGEQTELLCKCSTNFYDHSVLNPSVNAPDAVTKVPAGPKYAPVSHVPIHPDDPGHCRGLKSRIIFEADPCPSQYSYSPLVGDRDNPGFYRMSALEKFRDWRNKGKISKLKDGELRRNERHVILKEHDPCGPLGEVERWSDNLKNLEKWMKRLMPDSFVEIHTIIPINKHMAIGRFRNYIETLKYLLTTYPYHFAVTIEDDSILQADISQFYPRGDELPYDENKLRQQLSMARVYQLKGLTEEMEWSAAEFSAETHRQTKEVESGDDCLPVNEELVMKFKNDRYLELQDELVEKAQADLAQKCAEIKAEFEYVCQFIKDVQYLNIHGSFPNQDLALFKSMKPQVKRKRTSMMPNVFGECKKEEIDPESEAKKIHAELPWISEKRALLHMQRKAEDPDGDMLPLEVIEPLIKDEPAEDEKSLDIIPQAKNGESEAPPESNVIDLT